jgi:hypothetical protein
VSKFVNFSQSFPYRLNNQNNILILCPWIRGSGNQHQDKRIPDREGQKRPDLGSATMAV